MKILFCQTQFKVGGQQKVLLTIAKKLNEKHDVTVYYENHNFFEFGNLNIIKAKKSTQILNFFITLLINLLKLNFNKKRVVDDWHLRNLSSTMKGSEYDVVVLLNPYILFVDEVKNKILKASKVVCWTHNQYENYVDSCFKFEKEKLFSSMKLADQIVSLENYTASKWRAINPNTTIIHNPCTIESHNCHANLDNKIVSFVGRLQVDSKGLDYLCEVASYLDDDIIINVAGSGSKKDEKIFQNLINKYHVGDKIKLNGALNGKALNQHFINSSLFIMTSRYEGFPLVSIEAMSFGLPFVGFDIPSLQEVTSNGNYGKLIKLGNTVEMAGFINELLSSGHQDKLTAFSNLSKKRVKDFTLDKISEEWEKKVLS